MPAQVGDIISAYCSQCKENMDVDVVAVVGDEIVTVTCKTCGTSQRHRAAMDRNERARAVGRRVVDVGSGLNESPRPRSRAATRRVLSSTGREIVDETPQRRSAPTTPAPNPSAAAAASVAPNPSARPASMAGVSNEDLFKRWNAMTANLLARHGRPHRSNEAYKPGEIVLHTVHGMGVVEQVAPDGTLSILFKRGYETLPSTPRPPAPTPVPVPVPVPAPPSPEVKPSP